MNNALSDTQKTVVPNDLPTVEYISYRKGRRTDDLGMIRHDNDATALEALLADAALTTEVRTNHFMYLVRDETLKTRLREMFEHNECDTCRELGTLAVAFSDWKVQLGHDLIRKAW
jgi:hypothetical protein